MEEKVTVKWNGTDAEVVLCEINWGDDKKAKKKSVIIQEYKGQPMQFRDQEVYEEFLLIASIKSCPFDKTIQNLHKLSKHDGEKLVSAYKKINEVSEKDCFPDQEPGSK